MALYTRKNAVSFLVKNFDLPKSTADRMLVELFGDISKAMKKGRVQLHPFGSFEVTKLKARKGHNPKTGESIKIPARKRVKFKAYAGLKDTIG
jgi:DNA-binding protein HU-beta